MKRVIPHPNAGTAISNVKSESIWADSICHEEGRYSSAITIGQGTITEVVVSEGIEEVGEHAFNSSTVLEKLDLPSTLKQIGPDMIEYCPKLSELNIEYGITDIGFRAFDTYRRIDKSSLTKIVIPDSVKNIRSNAFGYLPLKNIKIPAYRSQNNLNS